MLAEQSGTVTRGGFTRSVMDSANCVGRESHRRRPDQRVGDRRRYSGGQMGGSPAGGAASRTRGGSPCCARPGSTGCRLRGDWSPGGPPDGEETLVASVDEYLPGAVDGWTWAVEMITDAASDRAPRSGVERGEEGRLAGGGVTRRAGRHGDGGDAARTPRVGGMRPCRHWKSFARCRIRRAWPCARERRNEIEAILGRLGTLAGTPVIEGHGDLHVGQVLRSDGRFVVTDFDGNPVLAAQRADAADSCGTRRRGHDAVTRACRDRGGEVHRPRPRSAGRGRCAVANGVSRCVCRPDRGVGSRGRV